MTDDILHISQQFGYTCGPQPGPADYTVYYTYDAESRLSSKTEAGVTTTYVYDSTGALAARKVTGGATTVYVEDLFEKNLSSGVVTKYYWFNGRRVAMKSASATYYLLSDSLGSTTTVLNDSGTIAALTKYFPFGRPWYTNIQPASNLTDKLFTGHQAEGSLYYMKARFYEPGIGRFMTPDTIVPDYEYAQSLNRYSYVMNNPVRYTDPTGHCIDGVDCPWDINNAFSQNGTPSRGNELPSDDRPSEEAQPAPAAVVPAATPPPPPPPFPAAATPCVEGQLYVECAPSEDTLWVSIDIGLEDIRFPWTSEPFLSCWFDPLCDDTGHQGEEDAYTCSTTASTTAVSTMAESAAEDWGVTIPVLAKIFFLTGDATSLFTACGPLILEP